ncbi:MAG: P-loop NTPase, partial [Anaerolineae bacterium]|nr:P-loop NTPase [Anaerolineae bacterium]
VVENMSYAVCPHCGKRFNLFGGGHAESLATSFDIPLLGRIGLDPRLAQACDNGNIEQFRSADFEPIVEAIQRSVAELKDRA